MNTLNKPQFKNRADFLAWKENNPTISSKPGKIKINNTEKLQALRNQGFKHKVKHFRAYNSPQGIVYLTKEQANIVSQFVPLILQSRGGFTELAVLKGQKVFKATSTCHDDDNFCYALGLKFCLDRIMEENK